MRISQKLQCIVMVASLVPLVIIGAFYGNLRDPQFNLALAFAGLVALFSGLLVSRPVRSWLYLRQLRMIRTFCGAVRQGDYGQRLPKVPPAEADHENELISLTREIDWMAHRIQRREEDLRRSIRDLELASDKILDEKRERSRVEELFGRFLAPEIVAEVIQRKDFRSMNKRTTLTILFSDIRGFTSLAETMAPEAVVDILNPYLEAMTRVILAHGGTVDKYEGDGIVAFFGEPLACTDHARRAVRSALAMDRELNRLNRRWLEQGRLTQALQVGIGIHTGEAFVGLVGLGPRVSYTVIGDAVNLTSRLQNHTKVVGWPLLVSGPTARQIQDEFVTEFSGSARFRGKQEPIDVFKVVQVRRQIPAAVFCTDEEVLLGR